MRRSNFFIFIACFIFLFAGNSSCYADDTQTLLKKFFSSTKNAQQSLERVRTYQTTQERILNNQRIQNQRTIVETTQRIQQQSREQRAALDQLKQKMDDLKRRQSYYTSIKKINPLKNYFNNLRYSNDYR